MSRITFPAWSPSTRSFGFILFLSLALFISIQVRAQSANDITYVYDELGRLVGVINPAGEAVTYTYDAVGNVLSISRRSSTLVSIIEFTPNGGAVGASVTIYGTGFSTTASQNTVTFNGVAATVTSATATRIVTSVPSGATTGPIGVTSPAGSATSSTPFTVNGSTAPTISGFTPTIGTVGTAVTITGTNFETVASNNRVKFNNTHSTISSATATTIVTSVPTRTGSGRISVGTPAGTAISSADFFVPPSPYTATDVAVTDRMVIGESKTVTMSTANKIGMVLFDGTAGQRVSLKVNSLSITSSRVTIYNPNGTTLQSATISASEGFFDTPVLPTSATYTILIDPDGTYTGSLNFTLYNATDVTGTITPGGSPVTVTTTTLGQNARRTFQRSAGQRVSLKVSGVAITGGRYNWVTVSINKPDGTTLASNTFDASGGFIDVQTLPVAGTYTILVDPLDTGVGSVTLTLYDVPADITTTITPGGSPVTVTTTTPGQNGQATFNGTANQRVSLKISGVAITGGRYNWVNVAIKKPDGTTLASNTFDASGGFIDVQTLPVTGTYAVFVDPLDSGTGSVTLTLYDVPADVTAAITPGGSPVTVTTTIPGQNGRATFNGTASQRVSLRISGVTITGGRYNWVAVSINKPDGTTLASNTFDASGGFIDVQILPVAGTYTILVDPLDTGVGSTTLTLYNVPPDVTASTTIGAPAVSVTTTVPGQNAQVTFAGTSNQRVTVRATNSTMGTVTVKLLKPDGAVLTSYTSYGSSNFNLATQTLPVTGTYTIIVDPDRMNTGSMTLSVVDESANLAFGRTATQSSTNWSAPADRAVDGNTDGNFWNNSVTHTQVENQAWWHVDLGSVQSISRIEVWNRTDCCGSALTNFYVFVSDQPFTSTDVTATLNQAGVSSYHTAGQGGSPTSITVNRTGRYVRVQLTVVERLSLAEVQVWRSP